MNKTLSGAFTLIEILIVVAIVGVLSGIVVVSMSDSQERARIAKSLAFSDSLRNSMITSLVSEWKLDENTGTTATDAWGSNEGTLVNNPTWKSGSECVSGSCLEFDGEDDYINCGSDSSLQNVGTELTVEAWINPTALTNVYDQFIGNYVSGIGGFALWSQTASGSRYMFKLGIPDAYPAAYFDTAAVLGEWAHVVGVLEGGVMKIYVNGVKGANEVSGYAYHSSTLSLNIGRYNTYYFDGLIDTVRVYNEALSMSQIQENYLAGLDSLLAKQAMTQQEYDNRLNNLNNYAQNI